MGTQRAPGEPRPDPRDPRRPPPHKDRKLFSSSWKQASAAEGVGVLIILLFVVMARPGPDAADVASGPDGYEAVASGIAADGAVALASGARVHLMGISLPSDEDAPVVRSAAFEMLDRLVRGRRVYVEFDPLLPSSAQEGQGLTVAYVWILDSNGQRKALANSTLLARGLARPVTAIGFARQQEFLQVASLAQQRGAGVWRPSEPALGGLVAPF